MGSNILISEQREEWAVRVLNALLDAFPRGIRMDSEGGRLPLHTACAGRATPRVVSTLITAYPAASRHRNKDGFLPLHLAAHWGAGNILLVLGEYIWQREVIPPEAQWQCGIDSCRILGDYADSKGIDIALELEPFRLSLLNSIDKMSQFVKGIGQTTFISKLGI